jgi:hypothetical protein
MLLTLYWIALLVGGFFVGLSLFGGDADSGDADFDVDVDAEADFDLDSDAGDLASGGGFSASDLISLRAILLLVAAFGLTGVLLHYLGTAEPLAAILAAATGLVVSAGGTYGIKTIGQAHVSADTGVEALLIGRTARVVVPFGVDDRGAIIVTTGAGHHRVRAASLGGMDTFAPGDEVVVIQVEDGIARVVRPGGELPMEEPASVAPPRRVGN